MSTLSANRASAFQPMTGDDIHLFNEGTHYRLYEKLGAHPAVVKGKTGVHFAVWAPNARGVFVTGDFNGWNKKSHPMRPRGNSGIWEVFLPELEPGCAYKYFIQSHHRAFETEKVDPFGFQHEVSPSTASIVATHDHVWEDADWMRKRKQNNDLSAPISIYELHLGSWLKPESGTGFLNYREIAPRLTRHLRELHFTHVEFLPLMEHPFYGSWGYQTTGYFAPTSRHGSPADLMYLIDYLHRHGIGVILDWVPSHFPGDGHGLAYFDGTHLFEHEDMRQGYHPDWHSYIFNYGRNEVRAFLISSAFFWFDKFHIDGLRVDAVASMLYLDYSRKEGEWIPNKFGGRENLEAIEFLKQLNTEVYRSFPDTLTMAEESTSWPMVSRPTYIGGLGFGGKWDMGWMHDTLQYFQRDPFFRKWHHGELTFRNLYAYSENFVLPLSHDEVVHGKGSLLNKMPGDDWQKFANLRLLYGLMTATPGKKLLFMGGELGQRSEWNHDGELEWNLLDWPLHKGMRDWVRDLNHLYRHEKALHEGDCAEGGFSWVDANDSEHSAYSWLRHDRTTGEDILCVFNCTPAVLHNFRVGVSRPGWWRELLNSDGGDYGGSGQGNMGGVESSPLQCHGRPHTLLLTLPPLAAVFFKASG